MKTNLKINPESFFEEAFPAYTKLEGAKFKQQASAIHNSLRNECDIAISPDNGLYRSFVYLLPAINKYLENERPFLIAVDTKEHQNWILNVEWPRFINMINEYYNFSIPSILTTVDAILPPPLSPEMLKSPGVITNFTALFTYFQQGKIHPGDYAMVCFDNATKLLATFEKHSIKSASYTEFSNIENEIRQLSNRSESTNLADLYGYYMEIFNGAKFTNLENFFNDQFQLNIDEALSDTLESVNQYLAGLRRFYQREAQPEKIMRLKNLEEIAARIQQGHFTWVDHGSGSSSKLNTLPVDIFEKLGTFLDKTPPGNTLFLGNCISSKSFLFQTGLAFTQHRRTDNIHYPQSSNFSGSKVICYLEPALKHVSKNCEKNYPIFLKERDEKMKSILSATGGKTLILFDSYTELEMCTLTLESQLNEAGFTFFDFHLWENKSHLLIELGKTDKACLLMTFKEWLENHEWEFHLLLNSAYKGEFDKLFIPNLPFPKPDAKLYFKLKKWENYSPGKIPRMDYMLHALKHNLTETLMNGWENQLSIAIFDSRLFSQKIWDAVADIPPIKSALLCKDKNEFVHFHNLAFNAK